MSDIVFHLADKSMAEGLRAFFRRDNWHYALGCRRFDIDPDSRDDIFQIGGCTDGGLWKNAHTNLATHFRTHQHAVIILDKDFDPYPAPQKIREDIRANMRQRGWTDDRFEVIVIEPMLEAWLWADAVSTAKGFGVSDFDELKNQLVAKNLWNPTDPKPKPTHMKAARDLAAKIGHRSTGSPIFREVFTSLSSRALSACVEPSFVLLLHTLQTWFPHTPAGGAAP
jgi:hypothetical protein